MSFADAGLRTVLVDGDTRRGALHEMFEMPSAPGLTDYLIGGVGFVGVLRSDDARGAHGRPCGTRRRRSPELLTSPQLVDAGRAAPGATTTWSFSIRHRLRPVLTVTRSPPRPAASSSCFGSARRSRRMAAEKLRMFERLPVNLIGAVLNGIQSQGEYGYYGYVAGYEARDEVAGPN